MKDNGTLVTRTCTAHSLRARRMLLIFILIGACNAVAFAQGGDDYHKLEVYGGYSLGRIESSTNSLSFTSTTSGSGSFTNLCSPQTGEMLGLNSQKFFCDRRNFNGFDASVVYNLTRYIGIKGNVTGHFKSETFVDVFTPPGITQTISTEEHLYNFLAGVQVKNQPSARDPSGARLSASVAE